MSSRLAAQRLKGPGSALEDGRGINFGGIDPMCEVVFFVLPYSAFIVIN